VKQFKDAKEHDNLHFFGLSCSKFLHPHRFYSGDKPLKIKFSAPRLAKKIYQPTLPIHVLRNFVCSDRKPEKQRNVI